LLPQGWKTIATLQKICGNHTKSSSYGCLRPQKNVVPAVPVAPGIHTKVAQVVAISLGCPLELIRVADTNSEVLGAPPGAETWDLGSTISSGYIYTYICGEYIVILYDFI